MNRVIATLDPQGQVQIQANAFRKEYRQELRNKEAVVTLSALHKVITDGDLGDYLLQGIAEDNPSCIRVLRHRTLEQVVQWFAQANQERWTALLDELLKRLELQNDWTVGIQGFPPVYGVRAEWLWFLATFSMLTTRSDAKNTFEAYRGSPHPPNRLDSVIEIVFEVGLDGSVVFAGAKYRLGLPTDGADIVILHQWRGE